MAKATEPAEDHEKNFSWVHFPGPLKRFFGPLGTPKAMKNGPEADWKHRWMSSEWVRWGFGRLEARKELGCAVVILYGLLWSKLAFWSGFLSIRGFSLGGSKYLTLYMIVVAGDSFGASPLIPPSRVSVSNACR